MRRLYAHCRWVGGRGPSLDNCQNRRHNSRVASNRNKCLWIAGNSGRMRTKDEELRHRASTISIEADLLKMQITH